MYHIRGTCVGTQKCTLLYVLCVHSVHKIMEGIKGNYLPMPLPVASVLYKVAFCFAILWHVIQAISFFSCGRHLVGAIDLLIHATDMPDYTQVPAHRAIRQLRANTVILATTHSAIILWGLQALSLEASECDSIPSHT